MSQHAARLRRLFSDASVLGVVLFAAPPAMAQHLVPNGRFDNGLAGWETRPEGAAASSTLDIDGSAASGSAQITNAEDTAAARVYPLRQCVVLSQAGPHFVGASGFVGPGATTAKMVFSYIIRASADCTGGAFSAGGMFLDQPGSWEHAEFAFTVAAAPSSIELLLGLEKSTAGGSVTGNIDDVYVMVDLRLFHDGFE